MNYLIELTLIAILFISPATFAAAAATDRPNIIYIMADDLGYGDLSCFGNQQVETPHLDRLAAEGLRLTDFHSSGNVCSPTRAGLLTGRYQRCAGIPGVINADPKVAAHHHGLQTSEMTFAELMREAGYATAIFGKWHLGYTRNFNPLHHGFDRFRGFVSGNIDYVSHFDRMEQYDWWDGLELVVEPGYSTHLITKHSINFIQSNRDRPFCLYVAHEAVHAPWQGPNDVPQRGPEKASRVPRPDQERAFREMLVELDRSVGEIVGAVKTAGLAERTLIFFCSDNGPAGGSAGPLRGRKGSNWEGGHRVPAIAWWPGRIPAGTECHELTITLDIMPTMLALADAAVPEGHVLDGMNLLPILTEGKSVGDRKLFWNGKAMRDGRWKLILEGRGGESVGLYDLAKDLGETDNLAATHPDRVERMRQQIKDWLEDVTTGATAQAGPS